MSYILDALKKSEQLRERLSAPTVSRSPSARQAGRGRLLPWLVIAVLIVNVGLLAVFLWPGEEEPEVLAEIPVTEAEPLAVEPSPQPVEPKVAEAVAEPPPTPPPPLAAEPAVAVTPVEPTARVAEPAPPPTPAPRPRAAAVEAVTPSAGPPTQPAPQAAPKAPVEVARLPPPIREQAAPEMEVAPTLPPAAPTPKPEPAEREIAEVTTEPTPPAPRTAPAEPQVAETPPEPTPPAPQTRPVEPELPAAPVPQPEPLALDAAMALAATVPPVPPVPPPAPAPKATEDRKPPLSAAATASRDAAQSYTDRGWANEAKGYYDRAIEDHTQALRLRPGLAEAYFGRGWAYERKGLRDKALADYSKAIDHNPDYTAARVTRGVLNLYGDQVDRAASDFAAILDAGGELRRYGLLWMYLARTRSGSDGKAALAELARPADLKAWPGPLISMFLGYTTVEQVLAEAVNGDPARGRERECVATFYVGQHLLLQGDTDGAAEMFRRTLQSGVTTFPQFAAAREELRRLGRLP